jgi:hypothetical protein
VRAADDAVNAQSDAVGGPPRQVNFASRAADKYHYGGDRVDIASDKTFNARGLAVLLQPADHQLKIVDEC